MHIFTQHTNTSMSRQHTCIFDVQINRYTPAIHVNVYPICMCACISDTCISGACTYVCICTTHKYIHIATAYMYIRRTSKLLYLRYTFECIANIHVQVYQIHVYQVSIHVNSHMCIDYKHISFECCSCELHMHTRYTCVLGIPHISGNKYEPYMLICIAI